MTETSETKDLFHKAKIHFKKGGYEKAKETYIKITEKEPDFIKAWNGLGLCYIKLDLIEKAIKTFKYICNIAPENEFIWRNLGIAYNKNGDYKLAIIAFKKGLEIKPNNASLWNSLGVSYGNINEFDEAIKVYKKALELNHKYEIAWKNLCIAYSRKGILFDLDKMKRKMVTKNQKTPSKRAKDKDRDKNRDRNKENYYEWIKKVERTQKSNGSSNSSTQKTAINREKSKKLQENLKKHKMEMDSDVIQLPPENQDGVSIKRNKKRKKKKTNPQISINSHNYKINDVYIVIDGANVALSNQNAQGKGKLNNIILLKEKLENIGITSRQWKIICDKSLQYKIDEPAIYKDLVIEDAIIETPAGTEADYFILQFAKDKKNAFVISNDRFRDHYGRFGGEWIKGQRITFKIIEDRMYFDKFYAVS